LFETFESSIKIENLLFESSEDMRMIDLKLGSSTLTNKNTKNSEKANYRAQKDKETTSAELGFCICGYRTKDEIGVKVHKQVSK
jgi:hypothetical protein